MKKLFFWCFLITSIAVLSACWTKQIIQTETTEKINKTWNNIEEKKSINQITTWTKTISTWIKQKINIIKNDTILFWKNKMTIEEIRKEYAIINENVDQYEMIRKNVFWESAEWWWIKYYLDNNTKVKKIVAKYFGEMWDTVYEFYYKNWDMFFIFQQEKNYSKPIYYKWFDENDFIIKENRFYFSEWLMFKRLDNDKKEINKNDETFKDKEKELIEFNIELFGNI